MPILKGIQKCCAPNIHASCLFAGWNALKKMELRQERVPLDTAFVARVSLRK